MPLLKKQQKIDPFFSETTYNVNSQMILSFAQDILTLRSRVKKNVTFAASLKSSNRSKESNTLINNLLYTLR